MTKRKFKENKSEFIYEVTSTIKTFFEYETGDIINDEEFPENICGEYPTLENILERAEEVVKEDFSETPEWYFYDDFPNEQRIEAQFVDEEENLITMYSIDVIKHKRVLNLEISEDEFKKAGIMPY